MKVTKQQYLNLVGHVLEGTFANPSAADARWDSYSRQQLIQGVMADVVMCIGMFHLVDEVIEEDKDAG